MSAWVCDMTVTVHDTEIGLIVAGRPVRNDTSVGEPEGWSLENAHLVWQDKAPVEDSVLAIIGEAEVEVVIALANERLLAEGPSAPDPDYLRERRKDAEKTRSKRRERAA